MKTTLYKYTCLLAAAFCLTTTACEPFTKGYDVNPNLPEDAPLNQRLTAVQISMGLSVSGELARISGIWTNQFTGTQNQYLGLEQYTIQASDANTPWAIMYAAVGNNARFIQQEATRTNNAWTRGVARALEAMAVGTAASLFGDVPYSQAFDSEQFPNPTFDSQAEVYAAVQRTLDEALADLNQPTGSLLGDIYYSGNLTRWKAAIHSLKARYFLHTKEYQKAVDNALLGVASSADNMWMPFPGTSQNKDLNPYFDFAFVNRAGYMDASRSFALLLLQSRVSGKTNETGRLNYYFDVEEKNLNYADGGFFAQNASFPVLTFEETQLILAESQFRLGKATEALAALNKVRAANAANESLKAAGTVVYEPYTAADFASDNALLKEILVEKYLSLLGQIEVWNDAKRLNNYRIIGIELRSSTATTIPQRLFYPQDEITTNPNTPNPIPSLFEPTPANR